MAERSLSERDLDPDPLRQFQRWLDEAWASGEPMANAMTLATTAPDGSPTARMVLLSRADEHGFAFETNLESPKAEHIAAQPRAALLFFWPILLRQVRISGQVSRMPDEDVRASFETLPPAVQAMIRACRRLSRIGQRSNSSGRQRWPKRRTAARPCRPTGVGSACTPRASSSGRAATTDCRTACD